MTNKYEDLDAAILGAIDRGASPLYAREVKGPADQLATESGREAFRVIDGRLQALKKSGSIRFVRGTKPHWVRRSAKPAAKR